MDRLMRRRRAVDVLSGKPVKLKALVLAKLGHATNVARAEAEIDALLRSSIQGDLETEVTRILVNLAFDELDKNSDGVLSRIEVLTGVQKPIVREMLDMGFTTPAAFNTIFSVIDVNGDGQIDRREWEAYFMHKLLGQSWQFELMTLLPTHMLLRWWRPFRARGFIFLKSSTLILGWNWLVSLCVTYSTVFLPLSLVFVQARWTGHRALDSAIDVLLLLDVAIQFRTSYRDRGYDVIDSRAIARHYLLGWFACDALSSFPFSSLTSPEPPADARYVDATPLEWLGLFRVLAVGRLVRMMAFINSTQTVRRMPALAVFLPVVCLMYMFVLMAHYLGLVYYMIAIRPLERDSAIDDDHPWFWLADDDDGSNATAAGGGGGGGESAAYIFAIRYTCSLYWALAVMTNLKGINAHETRQCLWRDPLVTNPLAERAFTIAVFIVGASFYSSIYGTIAQFISNLYAGGVRYQRRMEEVDEFGRFYRITPDLQQRIWHYADFHWSVTRGINIESLAGGLPKHLQLEIQMQLNKPMLEKVSIFHGLDQLVIEKLVSKLQLITVIAGEYVFYEGQVGARMFFVNRGVAHVVKNGSVVATLGEGDYFGELALLGDSCRTSDVTAATDLMLMALSSADLQTVLEVDPLARERMEEAAEQRLAELAVDDAASPVPPADGEPHRRISHQHQAVAEGADGSLLNGSSATSPFMAAQGQCAQPAKCSPAHPSPSAAADPLAAMRTTNARFSSRHRSENVIGRLTSPEPRSLAAGRRTQISCDAHVDESLGAFRASGSCAPSRDQRDLLKQLDTLHRKLEKLEKSASPAGNRPASPSMQRQSSSASTSSRRGSRRGSTSARVESAAFGLGEWLTDRLGGSFTTTRAEEGGKEGGSPGTGTSFRRRPSGRPNRSPEGQRPHDADSPEGQRSGQYSNGASLVAEQKLPPPAAGFDSPLHA